MAARDVGRGRFSSARPLLAEQAGLVARVARDEAVPIELPRIRGQCVAGLWGITDKALGPAGDLPGLGNGGAAGGDGQGNSHAGIRDQSVVRSSVVTAVTDPIGPTRSNVKNPELYDEVLYRARHCIENKFQRLKVFRRVVNQYEKTK